MTTIAHPLSAKIAKTALIAVSSHHNIQTKLVDSNEQ
jgi:hypothetical protein